MFNVAGYSGPIDAHSYAAVQRFRGLELFKPHLESYEMARRLRPPSWITFLSKEIVAGLGDLDAIRGALGRGDFGFTQLEHGASIRAGAAPRLADATRGEDVSPEQKALARVLQPYYSDNPAIIFTGRPQGDTLAWLRRHL